MRREELRKETPIFKPLLTVAAVCLVGACSTTSGAETESAAASAEQTPASDHGPGEASPGSAHGPTGAPPESGESFGGVVRETMDSGGYTYIHVELESQEMRWAAIEQVPLTIGDRVVLRVSMRMNDFRSKTLDRTFTALWFAYLESHQPSGAAPGADTGHDDGAGETI